MELDRALALAGKSRRMLICLGFLLTGLVVFYPALFSYFFGDDFAFLVIGRYLANPLNFFYHDHFPGGFFYRPVGMLSWWLSCKLAGAQPVLQNLVNILLHTANACVLFRVLNLVGANTRLNALLALIFLAHPLTMSTAMWLSDRFDLLATLFILVTIYFFLRYRIDGSRRTYLLSVASCILAFLSKELAYFTPIAITVAALYFNRNAARGIRKTIRDVAPFYAVALLVFGLRFMVLQNNAVEHYAGGNSLFNVVMVGMQKWLRFFPDYYLFYPDWIRWGAGAVLIASCLAILSGFGLRAMFKPGAVDWGMSAIGLTIMFAPAMLQAPVVFAHLDFSPDGGFDFTSMVDSRFYYLSFAGFLLSVQQPLGAACKGIVSSVAGATGVRAIYWSLALLAILCGMLSNLLGKGWNAFSNGQPRRVAELASLAVGRLQLPQGACKIYILDAPADSLYFREFSDSVIKALAPRGSPTIHCLVLTEKAPWYQIMPRGDLAAMQVAPLHPINVSGQAVPPAVIGDLAYVYLNVPDDIAVARDPSAVFIAFDGRKYVDVTQQVRSGSKIVNFYSDRP